MTGNISIFLNLPRLDLWPRMWSILEKVPCALEKNVKLIVLGTTENIVHTLETPLCLLHVITHHLQVNNVLAPIRFSYSYYHRLNLPVFELHINGIMYFVFFDVSLFSLLFMRFFCVFVIDVITCWFPLLYRLLLCGYSIAYLPILLFICMWVVPFRNIMYNNAASSFLDISFGAHLFAPLYLGIKLLNHKIQVCSLLVNNVK